MSTVPAIQDFDDPTFDPFAPENAMLEDIGEPHAALRALAARGGPVQEGSARELIGFGENLVDPTRRNFVILDPAIVREVLGDPELYSNEAYAAEVRKTFGNAINQMNPPEHSRFRRVFQKAFLPHVVASWSDRFVEPVLAELISEMKRDRKAELVGQFTHRYPFKIIFRQLNLPEGDIRIFQKLAETLSNRNATMQIPAEASRKLGTYLEALIQERRRNPGEDLISVMVQTQEDGVGLPDDVIVSFFRQLMNAAGDTTYRATGNLLVGLLRDRPDQYRQLVDDRSFIPKAVEEAMRWNGPIIAIHRMATRDVELGGTQIPAGAYLEPMYSTVGHDPKVHENPDQFDMTRTTQAKHFGFGYGAHVCIGQHLARLEMSRALNALLDHFPNLRLDPDYPPPKIIGWGLRTPAAIHVLLD